MARRVGKRRRRSRHAWLRGGLVAGLTAGAACTSGGDGGTPRLGADVMPADPALPAGGAGGDTEPAPAFGNVTTTLPTPPSGATVSPTPLQEPDAFLDHVVTHRAPAARVLYSWTTDEQFAELRDNPVLLSRTERPGLGGGLVREVLANLAAAGDPLSQALIEPGFQAARYAWPHPWATLLGWPQESYGTRLIQIVLREDAWIMTLVDDEWQVFDMDDQQVSRMDAIQNPQRIGAIFHVHLPTERDQLVCGGTFCGGVAGGFREYFVPNPAMIEQWALETEEMRARLEQDIAEIESYAAYVNGGVSRSFCPFETDVTCSWVQQGEPAGVHQRYQAAMAFASTLYEPTPLALEALVRSLRDALFEPDPFTHVEPGGS